jgi:hypothetical protein
MIRVIDDRGATATERVVVPGRFVTSWHFAKTTHHPWPIRPVARDRPRSDRRRCRQPRARTSRRARMSTSSHISARGPTGRVRHAALVLAALRAEFLTGSDDVLRVFDGKLIVERLRACAGRRPTRTRTTSSSPPDATC